MGKSKELAELVSSDGSIDVTNTLDLTSASGSRIYSDVANAYTYVTSINPAGSGLATHYHNANEFRIQTGNTDRLAVDASGRVTMPYQPAVMAHGSSGNWQGFMSGEQIVPYDYIVRQTGNHFNGSTSTFTAPIAGYYYISWAALVYPYTIPTGEYITMFASLNNSSAGSGYPMFRLSDQQNQTSISTSGIVYLNANDTLNVRASAGGSTTKALYLLTGHAHLNIRFIG